jgi:lipoprotein-anchoring transpeptidase ErfK/SrfK
MSSHVRPPGDGLSTPRMLAVGGAVATTALALAGSLGFGPGAASAARPPAHSTVTSSSIGSSSAGSDRADSQGSGTDAGEPSSQGSGRWLTVQDGSVGRGDSSASDSSTSGGRPGSGGTPDTGSAAGSEGTTGSGTSTGSASGSGSSTAAVAVPAQSGTGRRVVYDISEQRVWLVDADGSIERTYLVSGPRRESLVQPRTYLVESRSRHAVSYNQVETMQYMVRFTQGENYAIGFHDIPAYADGSLAQSRSDLGTPMSAGCIRQWEPDAKAMWRFAAIGTKVVVVA